MAGVVTLNTIGRVGDKSPGTLPIHWGLKPQKECHFVGWPFLANWRPLVKCDQKFQKSKFLNVFTVVDV